MKHINLRIENSAIRKIIGYPFLFFLFTLMISHSLNSTLIQEKIPNGTALILLSSIVVCVSWGQKTDHLSNSNLQFSVIVLLVVTFLYAFINGADMEVMKVMYLSISIYLLYKSGIRTRDVVSIGLIYGIATLYMLSRYNNLTYNSLGIITVFGFVCIINYLDIILADRKTIVFSVLAVFSCTVLAAMRMRGSILATIAIYVFTIVGTLKDNKKRIVAIFLVPVILMIFWSVISRYLTTYLIIDKYRHGDITSGRLKLWGDILSNSGLFGLGPKYTITHAHAHNTLIHFIGRYGYFYILFLIPVAYFSGISLKRFLSNNRYKNAFYRILIAWGILSITETIDFVAIWLYAPQFILLLFMTLLLSNEIAEGDISNEQIVKDG